MSLAEKLRKLRDQQNWSQETLATMMNMHRSKISRIETGKMIPDYQTLIQFADIFKIEKDYLIVELGQQDSQDKRSGYITKENLEDPYLVMIHQLLEKEPDIKKALVELFLMPPKRRAFFADLFINLTKVNNRHKDKM